MATEVTQEDLPNVLNGLLADATPEQHEHESVARRPPQVTVSWDGMQAFLTLDPAPEGYFEQEIQNSLTKANVVFGVDCDAVTGLAGNKTGCENRIVAQGTPVQHGVSGQIEYLFETREDASPEEHGGRVDWHELGLVKSVPAGTAIARRHPPEAGSPGKTVRGRLLPCKVAKDAPWKLGDGVVLSSDDDNVAVSTVQGAPRVDSAGRLMVDNVHVVQGDVDLSTGNLDYLGSIVVHGNVLPGFKLKASGDVEIRGVMEDAVVVAGGSVLLGSLVGSGAATVHAGRDIRGKFANNATLKARGDIYLNQEAVQCNIEAEGRVVVGGSTPTKGAIMGGSVLAGKEITVFRVGGVAGSKTKLRVGYDWVAEQHLQLIEQEEQAKTAQLKQMESGLDRLAGLSEEAMPNKNDLAKKLEESASAIVASLTELADRRRKCQALANESTAIVVHGPIRAGTELIVDGRSRVLPEERCGETFTCEGNTVVGVALKAMDSQRVAS